MASATDLLTASLSNAASVAERDASSDALTTAAATTGPVDVTALHTMTPIRRRAFSCPQGPGRCALPKKYTGHSTTRQQREERYNWLKYQHLKNVDKYNHNACEQTHGKGNCGRGPPGGTG
jgi:hypothetical protein